MILQNLSPGSVWRFFEALTQIPRPSGQEKQVLAYIQNLAQSWGLETQSDATGNLVVRKPGSPGKETQSGAILQAHVDMVAEQNRGGTHNFAQDPLKLRIQEDWLLATDTTLGADNGIGVAYALAVLEDKSLVHPPLEALFTVDEETALTGALNLDPQLIRGKKLINLDSEDEGIFTMGCAGGITGWGHLPLESQKPQADQFWTLALTGLPGGHSGVEIHRNIPNALEIGARILKDLMNQNAGWELFSIEGGDKHNAIPREVFCGIGGQDEGALDDFLDKWAGILQKEWIGGGLKLSLELIPRDKPAQVWTPAGAHRALDTLLALPLGPAGTSRSIPGLVETSSNLAAVKTEAAGLQILVSHRSSFLSLRDRQVQKTAGVLALAGGTYRSGDGYPAWSPNPHSPLLALCKTLWKDFSGRDPVVETIHAGLECGVIGDKIPGLDMISFGPTIRGAHSPQEKVHISSVDRVWQFLIHLLKEL